MRHLREPDGAAAYALASVASAASARDQWALTRLSIPQQIILILMGLSSIAALIWARWLLLGAVIVAISVFYAFNLVFRVILNTVGALPAKRFALARADHELPIYSIIVPMFREANMAAKIIEAFDALDYPQDRLDVLFAVEADDLGTIEALRATEPPFWARLIIVPKAQRCSKPRACNHALSFVRGSFVVVFDAEDRPEPGQLRESIAAFDAYGPRTVCLQARLIPHNRRESFMTRMFALDYCQWFDAALTGLVRLGFSVPLGGTSNHFRTAALVEAGAWDPNNMTEDADLGIRLGRLGMGVRTINATTFEEAPIEFRVWLKQRTRWIKGYIQTVFVHLRSGKSVGLGPLGYSGLGALLLFVASSVLFALVNPIFWALQIYSLFATHGELDWAFGPWVMPFARASFLLGNGLAILTAVLSPLRRGWWGLALWGLATPVYWIMVSLAAYRALFKFICEPFVWEKTPHGLVKRPKRKGRTWQIRAISGLSAIVLAGRADAGAWPQMPGYGLVISTGAYVFSNDRSRRVMSETYAEFGLHSDLTAVVLFDGDRDVTTGHSVLRGGGGLRYSTTLGLAPDWHLAAEASLRYQRQEDTISDPTLAGDGFGFAARADAGRGFDLWGRHGYVDIAATYLERARAPAVFKPEAVAALDFGERWQLGAAYFGDIAPGRFDDAGAYTKHEGKVFARWRFKPTYAVELSVSQTFIVDRIAQETTLRLALWSFLTPDEEDDDR